MDAITVVLVVLDSVLVVLLTVLGTVKMVVAHLAQELVLFHLMHIN